MLRVFVPLVICRYARRELNMLFECEEALRIVGRLIKQPEIGREIDKKPSVTCLKVISWEFSGCVDVAHAWPVL